MSGFVFSVVFSLVCFWVCGGFLHTTPHTPLPPIRKLLEMMLCCGVEPYHSGLICLRLMLRSCWLCLLKTNNAVHTWLWELRFRLPPMQKASGVFWHFKVLAFQGIPRPGFPTQACCTHPEILSSQNFFTFCICLGSLEAYQHVWSSSADLSRGHVANSRHMGLCPAFSQAVRFIARSQAGKDPAALVPHGGTRFSRHRLGNSGQRMAALTVPVY